MNIYDTPEEQRKRVLNEVTKYTAIVVVAGIVILMFALAK